MVSPGFERNSRSTTYFVCVSISVTSASAPTCKVPLASPKTWDGPQVSFAMASASVRLLR
jgi:hypothetical protein